MMDKCFYCDAGPFEDVKGWALHKCKSKYDLANDNKQLRERIAELEGRTCDECKHNFGPIYYGVGNSLLVENWIVCNKFSHSYKIPFSCSAFEPKKEGKP